MVLEFKLDYKSFDLEFSSSFSSPFLEGREGSICLAYHQHSHSLVSVFFNLITVMSQVTNLIVQSSLKAGKPVITSFH